MERNEDEWQEGKQPRKGNNKETEGEKASERRDRAEGSQKQTSEKSEHHVEKPKHRVEKPLSRNPDKGAAAACVCGSHPQGLEGAQHEGHHSRWDTPATAPSAIPNSRNFPLGIQQPENEIVFSS